MRCIIIATALGLMPSLAMGQAHLLLRPQADQVLVDYSFSIQTQGFRFHSAPQPEARITSPQAGITIDTSGISAQTPLDHYTLALAPDRRRTDATYPVLTRLAAGWMIYLPALLARPAAEVVDIELQLSDGWQLETGPADNHYDGFIYIRPADAPAAQNGVQADPAIPQWLVQDVQDAATSSNAYYSARLRLGLPLPPLVLISPLPPEDRNTYVGDVTPNGVINLQIAANALPPERDTRFTDMVQPFVAHEIFHNWQGTKGQDLGTSKDQNGRWLNEGAAEYFSLIAQGSLSSEAAARSRALLGKRLASCLSRLETEARGLLALSGDAAQQTRYDCGTAVHWVMDVEATTPDGAWGVWRDLLSIEGGYNLSHFITASNAKDSPALTALLDGGQDVRAATLRALERHTEVTPPTASAWANASVWPLLETHCQGQMGIMTTPDGRWILDTGQRCGPLSDDPEILGIGEHRFNEAGAKAFSLLVAVCAQQGEVPLHLKRADQVQTINVHCARRASPPETNYQALQLR